MNPESITLYYREGRSDKVYMASLVYHDHTRNWDVDFGYGRRGSTMTHGKKAHAVSYAQAKKIYDKLVAEKRAKGYRGEAEPIGQPISGGDVVAVDRTPSFQIHDTGIHVQLLNECGEIKVMEFIDNPRWGMQVKMDGRRQLIRKTGNTVELINRRGLVLPVVNSAIFTAARAIPGSGTIDGEACGDSFHAFDMLTDGREDLRTLSYTERYSRLALVLNKRAGAIKLLPMALTTPSKLAMYEMAKRTKCEGIVLKLLSAPYSAGRPAAGGPALKYKFYATASCIVHQLNARRSVKLMVYNEHGIGVVIGNVTVPPNHRVPELGDVIEVRYLYCFPGGSLYQPTYLGKRDDISADECTLEQLKFKQSDEEEES